MEDGINPEIYSAIQSQNLIDKNQKSAGKIKAYEVSFHNQFTQ